MKTPNKMWCVFDNIDAEIRIFKTKGKAYEYYNELHMTSILKRWEPEFRLISEPTLYTKHSFKQTQMPAKGKVKKG